ncbi:hypothetical protein HMPREF0484_1556 [Klebsiella pneumoniae subsp. rhinoscleromatis ATCC 13884]|nr:hypothetical protein HMPREF0484_1556 [Klebsiella pneumoniae subsp. rhinoscleromatis ATCC 13884]
MIIYFDTLSHKPGDGLPEKSSIVLAITFRRSAKAAIGGWSG